MRHDIGDHAVIRTLTPKIERSLQHSKGLSASVIKGTRDVDVYSRGGVYLGSAVGFDVSVGRLDRVAKRIVSGLYFHNFRKRIEDDREVEAFCTAAFDVFSDKEIKRRLELMQCVTQNQEHRLGENVFSYWFQLTSDDPTVSVWVLRFYGKVFFLCFVTPRLMHGRRPPVAGARMSTVGSRTGREPGHTRYS